MSAALFDQLRRLNLGTGDYAVFGSGPLLIRNIIPSCNDLDIVCRGDAWEAVRQIGATKYLPVYDVTVASLCDGALTFGTKWGIGDVDVGVLIDTAELIDSLPFVRLEHVVRYKTTRSSARDLSHLAAMKAAGYLP